MLFSGANVRVRLIAGNNRPIARLIAARSQNLRSPSAFFLILQAQQRRRMDRHQDAQSFIYGKKRTPIALDRDHSTGQPARGSGSKRNNKTRAYRLDLLE
jgi:antitoxin (DNA-binding transcriptional repressor) of toxin-antitoxin stability system